MAAETSRLKVVPEGTIAPRKPSAKIADALDGSSRDVLASMRLALARKLDAGEVSSNSIASAYKELRELDRLIRTADAEDETEDDARGSRPRRSFNASAI